MHFPGKNININIIKKYILLKKLYVCVNVEIKRFQYKYSKIKIYTNNFVFSDLEELSIKSK